MAEQTKYPFDQEHFIPEGLEYKEDYWYGALSKIERYERGIFWRKAAWMAVAACTVGAIVTAAVFHFRSQNAQTTAANAQPQATSAPAVEPMVGNVQDSSVASNGSGVNREEVANSSVSSVDATVNAGATDETAATSKHEKRIRSEDRTSLPTKARKQKNRQRVYSNSSDSRDALVFTPKHPGGEQVDGKETVSLPITQETSSNAVYPATPNEDIVLEKVQVSRIMPLRGAFDSEVAALEAGASPLTFDPIKKWNVYAAVGSSFLTAYATQRNNVAFDPYARVGLSYRMAPQWRVSAGLELTTVSNLTASYGSVNRTYDFSYRNTITKVNTDALYLLTLPVMVERNISPQVHLSAGAGMSYLFAGSNTVRVSEETISGIHTLSNTQENGYIRGFRTFQPFLSASVAYSPNKKWSVALGYQFGLTDVTLNNYYTSSVNDRNSRCMIELKRFIR